MVPKMNAMRCGLKVHHAALMQLISFSADEAVSPDQIKGGFEMGKVDIECLE